MRRLLVVAMCACGEPSGPPDDSIDYRLFVIHDVPDLALYIEGLGFNPYQRQLEAIEPGTIEAELREGELVVDRIALPHTITCDDLAVVSIHEDACATSWGELRWGSTTLTSADGDGCHIDGFCEPTCHPDADTLCPGGKCGLSRPALDRPWSKIECVAAGGVEVGGTCTWSARDDGRFVDDCVRDSLCVDGTCVALCLDGAPMPGYPPEILVCPSAIR